MPNGKPGDSPLTDLIVHGAHPFPQDIEDMLREIDALGRREGYWPLGENWPFGMQDVAWARGENLDEARKLLTEMLALMRAGRADEILVKPKNRHTYESLRGKE